MIVFLSFCQFDTKNLKKSFKNTENLKLINDLLFFYFCYVNRSFSSIKTIFADSKMGFSINCGFFTIQLATDLICD